MKKYKKKLIISIFFILTTFIITGCTNAFTVSTNLSTEANMFNVKRRITFINLRTDSYLFSIEGNCSIQGTTEIQVICKIGEDKYQKHFFGVSTETTYIIEQLEYNNVSKYDYKIIFRPEAIIPIEIKTDKGE